MFDLASIHPDSLLIGLTAGTYFGAVLRHYRDKIADRNDD